MSEEPRLLLFGVFRELVSRGVPLGIADYLDALRALQMGFGMSGNDAEADAPSRQSLLRLCRILWARDSREARLIETLFDRIPPPPLEPIRQADDALEPLFAEREVPAESASGQQFGEATPVPSEGEPHAVVSIERGSNTEGLGLPQLSAVDVDTRETYVFQPQTVISPRNLAVLWRRFRERVPVGPPVEFDLEATIRAYCRQGALAQARFRPLLVNQGKILILADTSPSMTAWFPFLEVLAESLSLGGLESACLVYFSNVPRRKLYVTPQLARPVSADSVFQDMRGAGVLVVSDAGAVRGFLNHRRVKQTLDFLGHVQREMRAVAWVNPMPRDRWSGNTAGGIANQANNIAFLPLQRSALIRAIDILRGMNRS